MATEAALRLRVRTMTGYGPLYSDAALAAVWCIVILGALLPVAVAGVLSWKLGRRLVRAKGVA